MSELRGIQIVARNEIGVLRDITTAVAEKGGNITYAQSFIIEGGEHKGNALIYLEVEGGNFDLILKTISDLPTVIEALEEKTFKKVFGKRILIFGGGALVSQAALGAISEADRHNLRGEHISVDTMPVIGEEELAEAVRAVARLHRAEVLILAGGLMGGKISEEIKRLRKFGIPVISLNMFGSVPRVSDLVVNDPVMAGTLAVMHISEKGKFDIERVKGKRV
ncbi:MAG TPA: ACT domain-containing protein [Archaeoglobaceae archaeon]|nr:ACT domain-containing protein [Archaeoglobaceae archaeon]